MLTVYKYITTFYAAYKLVPIFPTLGNYAPLIQKIRLNECGMHDVPVRSMIGLREVQLLVLHSNKLSKLTDISFINVLGKLELYDNQLALVPGLYELPLTTLTLVDSQLMRDEALW